MKAMRIQHSSYFFLRGCDIEEAILVKLCGQEEPESIMRVKLATESGPE